MSCEEKSAVGWVGAVKLHGRFGKNPSRGSVGLVAPKRKGNAPKAKTAHTIRERNFLAFNIMISISQSGHKMQYQILLKTIIVLQFLEIDGIMGLGKT